MSEERGNVDFLGAKLFEAQALIDRRRYPQARAIIKEALQFSPDNPAGLYLAAFVEYADGDADGAMAGVARVLQLAPEHYGARRLRATLLEDAGKPAEAEGELISLLRDYPEDADSYGAYARLMLSALETDKARRLAQEGLRYEPAHEISLYVLALLDVIEGRSKGAGALQQMLQEYPERLHTSVALVTSLSHRGDQGAALRVAQELLRSSPTSPELVELVRELRYLDHWSMKPLYPLQRWGWGGSIALYVGAVLVLTAGKNLPRPVSLTLTFVWLGYCVYSWVWPRMLKGLLR